MRGKRRKRIILGPREEDILEHLSAGDVLMSILLSSRSTRAMFREARKKARERYRDRRSVEALKRKGLVSRRGDLLALTESGKELCEILASRAARADEVWKGHWWIIMYDIPVSMSSLRFELRRTLILVGFRKLQHSVWVHPHPSKEIELFLKRTPRMNRYVHYVAVLPFPGLETMADWKKLSTV